MENVQVKICGLSTPETIAASCAAGAAYVGFNFIQGSPRYVSIETAARLASAVPDGVAKVALTLNADDTILTEITRSVSIDMLQLHGSESAARVAEVKVRSGLPVIKAVGIARAVDLDALDTYGAVADMLLVDAKPPTAGDLPGGNGLPFDWRLIAGRKWPVPWMLAGGLNAGNVAEAVRLTGARQVDLSSSVESAPGVKDPELIRKFFEALPG